MIYQFMLLYREVFHAEENIEVCLGGIALRAIGADRGGRRAGVPLFPGLRNQGVVTPSVPVRSENVFGMIRQGHAAFASDHSFAKTAGDKQAYR